MTKCTKTLSGKHTWGGHLDGEWVGDYYFNGEWKDGIKEKDGYSYCKYCEIINDLPKKKGKRGHK